MSSARADDRDQQVILAIHGGIGLERHEMTPELSKELRAALRVAIETGRKALEAERGSSLDAVEAAIRSLEDSPLFNAGRGAVFTHEGRNELDASIMNGRTKAAGSVASVTIIKNPITAARAVMERSPHVMLIGRGAEVFATRQGLDIVDPGYFWTEQRWRDIQRRWEKERQEKKTRDQQGAAVEPGHAWGTVGAVALDRGGDLAAGTSTGGMTNKLFGRVGDSPIIGAGTYADNAGCAVSCTGHGEFFIRFGVAHEINALMKYRNLSIDKAAGEVIHQQLKPAGGEGGAIALDKHGNFAASYNTDGMYRAWLTRDGKTQVKLHDD
ncbi:MAG: isoaspartyl peptidase/L-asparaginase [Planctomycetes bacterium]|nr:isoaspartyl peptidase/L-asparaginase [Planctomycetota bacterium]